MYLAISWTLFLPFTVRDARLATRMGLGDAPFPAECLSVGMHIPFCLSTNHESKGVRGFKTFLEQFCHNGGWDPIDAHADFHYLEVFDTVVNGSLMRGELPYDDMRTDRASSNTQIETSFCSDDTWIAWKIGPFASRGGSFWSSFNVLYNSDPLHLPRTAPGGGRYAFSGHAFGSIDARSSLIGYPPVHQHHFHFGYAFSLPPYSGPSVYPRRFTEAYKARTGSSPPEAMSTHGDHNCLDAQGGVDCIVVVLPDDMAFVEKGPLGAMNSFIDVRSEGAAQMETWQLMALKLPNVTSLSQRVTLSHMFVRPETACDSDACWEVAQQRYTYDISVARESVVWDTGVLDLTRYLDAHFHAHASLVTSLWLFQAPPASVFYDVAARGRAHAKIDYSPGSANRTMWDIYRRQGVSGSASLACSLHESAGTDIVEIDGAPARLSRRARCPLNRNLRFWTLVAMVIPSAHVPGGGHVFRTHTYIKVWVADKIDRGQFVIDADSPTV